MSEGVRCMWMRGGTSKGGYFLASDLPADPAARDALLLGVMGSPDPRQIDGMGGADPLTSKVAVVRPSARRRRRCRLPVPAGLRRSGDRHRRPELRQHPGRRRPVRDRARAGRGCGWRDHRHDPHGRTPGRSRSRAWRRQVGGSAMTAMRGSMACRGRQQPSRSRFATPRAPAAARCCPPAMPPTRSMAWR